MLAELWHKSTVYCCSNSRKIMVLPHSPSRPNLAYWEMITHKPTHSECSIIYTFMSGSLFLQVWCASTCGGDAEPTPIWLWQPSGCCQEPTFQVPNQTIFRWKRLKLSLQTRIKPVLCWLKSCYFELYFFVYILSPCFVLLVMNNYTCYFFNAKILLMHISFFSMWTKKDSQVTSFNMAV